MLSKSTARNFFLGTTILFSLVFLGMTVDTIRQTPKRTNAHNLTPLVAQGQKIWTDNNCMGCHTLMGEGAYYAPELTKVYERRGAAWIKMLIKDPQAMYPGERKMVQYDFTDQEIDALIAFFKWVGEIDLNGFPAEPDLAPKPVAVSGSSASAQSAAAGEPRPGMYDSICAGCHAIGGKGGSVGPALDDIGARMTEAELDEWLADPASIRPGTTMPQIPMSDDDRAEMAAFLAKLKG